MATRKIITEGNPTLSKICRPVTSFDERLATLIDDMKETVVQANGIGLAAPQVGVLRRVVVVDLGEEIIELVNPKILKQSGEQDGLEGCLSVPGQFGMVKRPNYVKLEAQDRHGDWYEYEGEELIARCFCHELEHLDGHLYTERAYRMLTREEYEELMQQEQEQEEQV
ncbi:MAG: peptide deformylase [Oscillospiraceae bacterium]|nr:peptide deformylase [Oscillospiraceae bacterium]